MPKPSLLTGIHAHEFSCANQKHAQQPLYLQSWPRKVRLRAKKTRFLPSAPSRARTAPLTNAEGLALRPRRLTPLSPRSQAGVRARISAPQKGEEARRLRQKKSEPNAIVAPPNLTRRSPQEDRQGARHDRVPQVSRSLQCINRPVRRVLRSTKPTPGRPSTREIGEIGRFWYTMSPGFSVYEPLLIQRIRAIEAKPDAHWLAPYAGHDLLHVLRRRRRFVRLRRRRRRALPV